MELNPRSLLEGGESLLRREASRSLLETAESFTARVLKYGKLTEAESTIIGKHWIDSVSLGIANPTADSVQSAINQQIESGKIRFSFLAEGRPFSKRFSPHPTRFTFKDWILSTKLNYQNIDQYRALRKEGENITSLGRIRGQYVSLLAGRNAIPSDIHATFAHELGHKWSGSSNLYTENAPHLSTFAQEVAATFRGMYWSEQRLGIAPTEHMVEHLAHSLSTYAEDTVRQELKNSFAGSGLASYTEFGNKSPISPLSPKYKLPVSHFELPDLNRQPNRSTLHHPPIKSSPISRSKYIVVNEPALPIETTSLDPKRISPNGPSFHTYMPEPSVISTSVPAVSLFNTQANITDSALKHPEFIEPPRTTNLDHLPMKPEYVPESRPPMAGLSDSEKEGIDNLFNDLPIPGSWGGIPAADVLMSETGEIETPLSYGNIPSAKGATDTPIKMDALTDATTPAYDRNIKGTSSGTAGEAVLDSVANQQTPKPPLGVSTGNLPGSTSNVVSSETVEDLAGEHLGSDGMVGTMADANAEPPPESTTVSVDKDPIINSSQPKSPPPPDMKAMNTKSETVGSPELLVQMNKKTKVPGADLSGQGTGIKRPMPDIMTTIGISVVALAGAGGILAGVINNNNDSYSDSVSQAMTMGAKSKLEAIKMGGNQEILGNAEVTPHPYLGQTVDMENNVHLEQTYLHYRPEPNYVRNPIEIQPTSPGSFRASYQWGSGTYDPNAVQRTMRLYG